MKQKFQAKLLKDIPKKPRSKSLDFRARFGAINSASKTKEYLSKDSMNLLRVKNKQALKLLVPKSGSFYFSGNSFCQLPIFQFLFGHVEKHPVCPYPTAFSVFLFLFSHLSFSPRWVFPSSHFFLNGQSISAFVPL